MSSSFANFSHSLPTDRDSYQAYHEGRYQDAYHLLNHILQTPLEINQQQIDPHSLRSKCIQRIDLHYLQLKCMTKLCQIPLKELKAKMADTEHTIKTLPLSASDRESYLTTMTAFNHSLTEIQQAIYQYNYALGLSNDLVNTLENCNPIGIYKKTAKKIKSGLKIIENEAETAALIFTKNGEKNDALDAMDAMDIIIHTNDRIANWLESSSTGHNNLTALQLADECYQKCIQYYQQHYQLVFLGLHLSRFYIQERIAKLKNNEENAKTKLREFIQNYFDQEPLEQYLTTAFLHDGNEADIKADILQFIYERFQGAHLAQLITYHIKDEMAFRQQFEEFIGISLPTVPSLEEAINSRVRIQQTENGPRYFRVIDSTSDKEKKLETEEEKQTIEEREFFPLQWPAEHKEEDTLQVEKIQEDRLDLERAQITSRANIIPKSEIDPEDLDPAYLDDEKPSRTSSPNIRSTRRSPVQSSSSSSRKRRHSHATPSTNMTSPSSSSTPTLSPPIDEQTMSIEQGSSRACSRFFFHNT